MPSDQPQMGGLIIDPAPEPSTPTSYAPRDSLAGTRARSSHGESILLPDSPLSATDSPRGEVWLPRLSGGRKLHLAGTGLAPVQMAGAYTSQKSSAGIIDNPNNRQNENTPVFSGPQVPQVLPVSPPRSMVGKKVLKDSNHQSNHDNVNYPGPRNTEQGPENPEEIKQKDQPNEESYDDDEISLTGCEYESDDLAEDIRCGLEYGHRKRPASSLSRSSSNERTKGTIDESTRQMPLDQIRGCPHGPPPHEPASNMTVPDNSTVKDKGSRFKLLGKNGFLTSWRKPGKILNLEERNLEETIPRDRHYEGCILCPPQPSPRTSASATSTVEGQELYAPSGQNPGPPPLTPPPSPSCKDTKGKSSIDQAPLIVPTSYNVMRDLLGSNNRAGQPGPSNYYQGPSNTQLHYNHYPASLNGSLNSSYESPNLNGPLDRFSQAGKEGNKSSRPLSIRMELSPNVDVNKKDEVEEDIVGHYNYDEPYRRSQDRILTTTRLSSRASYGTILGHRGSKGLIRLSDDMSEGPHPGIRRDHRYLGVDGIYEMVDMEPMSDTAIVPNIPIPPPIIHITHLRPKRWSMKSLMKRFDCKSMPAFLMHWKLAILGILVLLALMSTIILLVVAIPSIMKKKVDRTTVEVTAFHLSDISYNYTTVTLDLKITSNASIRTNISPVSFSFESDNDYNYDFYHSKKQNGKNKSEIYKNYKYTTFGNLYSNKDVDLGGGNGNMFLTSQEDDGDHERDDVKTSGFWRPEDMVEILIWGPNNNESGMRSVIRGDIHIQAQGFTTWADIIKKVNINSMDGFLDLKVDSYKFLQPQKGFIDANITWFNPSVVTMDLETAHFDLFLGEFAIGDAKIASMKIFPGYNHAHLSSSLFDRDIFRSNKTFLGELISSIASEETGPTRGELLRLKGRSITVNDTEIDWLQPIIRLFDKDLPVDMNEQILTNLTTNIFLTMTPDGKTRLGRGSNIECKLKLPFETDDFLITVRGAGYFLDISLPLTDVAPFLRIESTMNSRDQTILSGVHTLTSSLVGSSSSVIEENILKNVFMPDFIKAENLPIGVRGSMAVDLDTPYGEGRISGIKIENHVWHMKGLHGLDSGGKRKVIISNENVMDRIWTVSLQIQNPSDMFVNFGNTEFDVVQKENPAGCIGTISVEKLTLDYGTNNITGKFDLAAQNCGVSDAAQFLSSFMTGGRNDLSLRTTSHHEVMGFAGLEIEAEWISAGYRLFDSIDLVIYDEHKFTARISLRNPLGVVLTLDSVDMELVLAKSDKVIATITSGEHFRETVMGGQSSTLSEIPSIPAIPIEELVEIFQRELLSETPGLMPITVSGTIHLVLADYEAPVFQYKQESVEVKLRWED